jgi:negative regulator of sigma-B (phosphoserine phosphatase)
VVPCDGERVAGDAVLVRAISSVNDDNGDALVAVIDALGHGVEAAAVAATAIRYLEDVALSRTVLAIIEGLHGALRGSRGAAGMLCVVRAGTLEGCGVGNVELRASRGKIPVVLSPGVLGGHIRKLRVFRASLAPGERLAMFSDGLSSRLDLSLTRGLPASAACDLLLERFRRPHDDASVLILDLDE